DSLYAISKKYKVRIADLRKWNANKLGDFLQPGQTLTGKGTPCFGKLRNMVERSLLFRNVNNRQFISILGCFFLNDYVISADQNSHSPVQIIQCIVVCQFTFCKQFFRVSQSFTGIH
ncbi:MAG TPA: LysM domain-containing protein, partial [Desulfobacterales bacterium]|nr:LysM domain-containing protein [Desulfobacterales bacterium]